jgi:predicted DCC family thiol-disulfide oxidoreductase YuxK
VRPQALGRPRPVAERASGGPLLLYDARCGVCRRFVSLVVHADRAGTISIAPLVGHQGDDVRRHYPAFGARDSAIWVPRDGRALAETDAILAALAHVGGIWSFVAKVGGRVPRHWRNRAYRWFAGNRRRSARFGLPGLERSVQSRTLPPPVAKAHDYRR